MVHAVREAPARTADAADLVKGSMGLAMGAGLAMKVVADRKVLAARCTAGQMAHAAREAKAAARCVAPGHEATNEGCAADRVAKDAAKDAVEDVVRVGRTRLTGLARRADRVDQAVLRGVAVDVAHARVARCAVVPRGGQKCVAHAAAASTARARRADRKVAAVRKAAPSAARARSLTVRGTIADLFAASLRRELNSTTTQGPGADARALVAFAIGCCGLKTGGDRRTTQCRRASIGSETK